MLFAGAISGQLSFWDISDEATKIMAQSGDQSGMGDDDDEDKQKVLEDGEEDTNTIQRFKTVFFSAIRSSHRSAVADIKWVPKAIKVDRRAPSDGVSTSHVITCGEDGQVLIWDVRTVTKEARKEAAGKEIFWEPFFKIQLFRVDGTGDMGLTRLLFRPEQEDTIFYASTDEGDIIQVDWSVKPPGGDQKRGPGSKKEEVAPEYIIEYRGSERNFRPVLEFARSPFFDDLLLTVHDFHFAIWKTTLKGYEDPIY
jgi:WD40 repeat protein